MEGAGLYLVATPLGNLGDLSPRAREILSRASFIAGESSASVLKWLEILQKDLPREWARPGVLSYRESSRERDGERILQRLSEGHSVALISDAGTPAVSDPGWLLVGEARERGFPVIPVPGPCAAVMALSASGFPSRRFRFEGFLPTSGRQKREALERLANCSEPVVIYESPHRVLDTLEMLASEFPHREVFVSREMTKRYEEHWRGELAGAVREWRGRTVKGEFTLVLGPLEVEEEEAAVSEETLEFVRSLGLPTRLATSVVTHFLPQADKKAVYKRLAQNV